MRIADMPKDDMSAPRDYLYTYFLDTTLAPAPKEPALSSHRWQAADPGGVNGSTPPGLTVPFPRDDGVLDPILHQFLLCEPARPVVAFLGRVTGR
jgi:hypothetical protein